MIFHKNKNMLDGLSNKEVEESRKKHGSNEITTESKTSFFSQFLQSFDDPIIKILLVALAINVVVSFDHFDGFEMIGICVSIFLSTFVSTLSEYQSESAFRQLEKENSAYKSRVNRAGKTQFIGFGNVVVGDVVLLQSGERIPADGDLIDGNISVDQSSLNGESKEAKKTPIKNSEKHSNDIKNNHSLFSGTVVCGGAGAMRVTSVGKNTYYGQLADDLKEATRESPLKVRLAKLANTLSKIGYLAAVLVMIADLANSFILDNAMQWNVIVSQLSQPHLVITRVLHALTLAITTVVVAVPEGLPMMITIVLSSNMKRMLKDHVLVRKLVGIETSGSMNILFTDKTGTLTQGKLKVSRWVLGDGTMFENQNILKKQKALWQIIELSCIKNNESTLSYKKVIGGNATDKAIMEFACPASKGCLSEHISSHIPFDSKNKFSVSTVVGEKNLTLIKGAPELIVKNCDRYYDSNGKVQNLNNSSKINQIISSLTDESMRVIAFAVSESSVKGTNDFSHLVFVGIAGIRDELREDAKASVAQVQNAGIQVVMVTGDNKNTAVAIAKSCGLIGKSGFESSVITSDELAKLNDDDVSNRLSNIKVVARALPKDKSRLVKIAQNNGLVVGMTGDGVNDAPALKHADVGFAMGNATEVAKQASDVVVLNNSFASIEKAILYGRTIFKSIRKFIIFQLTMNLCAVGISVIAPLIGIDTPITVIQMLWINIIMDTLAGLAFAGEPPLMEYMKEKPKRRDEAIINKYMLSQIFFTGIYSLMLGLVFLKLPYFQNKFNYGVNQTYFMTAFFALFVFSGIFNSFNAHTHSLNIVRNLSKNKGFVLIMLLICVAQFLMMYCGGSVFRTVDLEFKDLIKIISLSLTVIPADIIRKILMKNKNTGV